MENAINIQNLTKYYGKARGIKNVNLTVPKGSFFGFIGPNGSGKSTTIRTLLGLIKATSGSASVLGFDIEKDKNEILKRVGYLPSETVFYSGMKVCDILKLSQNLRKTDCTKTALSLCERLQLDTNRKVDELSFGNRKKVGIVCALQHNPELLILDEPTSGLDPLMQKEFFSILKERNQDGATVFLSSHVLSEIQRNCTDTAIIRNGSIIVCDSVNSLSKTSAKRVSVSGEFDLSLLNGAKDVKVTDNTYNFLYGENINDLLSALSKGNITDLTINEPDLDEIFMHYYTQEATQ